MQFTGGFSRAVLADGTFSATLPPGTYNATFSGPGYNTATVSTLIVSNGGNKVYNTCLTGNLKRPTASAISLTSESCNLTGAVDPAETVTVSLGLKNTGTLNTNVVATLQANGGVTNPTSAPQNDGTLIADGATVFRPFTFAAGNVACGSTLTVTLQLQEGATNLGTVTYNLSAGNVSAVFSEGFDAAYVPDLPDGWVAANSPATGTRWVTSLTIPDAGPADAFIDAPASLSDKRIDTPPIFIPAANTQLSFRHTFSLENNFDGGVLEVSSANINGGAFTDIMNPAVGANFVAGFYYGFINNTSQSPIGNRMAWTGSSGGYITTLVNLGPNLAGQTIKLRFRMASDSTTAGLGWRIDTVRLTSATCCAPAIFAAPPFVITAEKFSPFNGAPDPGETITISLPLVNLGTTNTSNLVATLQAANGVTNPSAPQSYGVVAGGGAAVARPFTCTAGGNCGDLILLTLNLQDGALNLGSITYPIRPGTTLTQTFSNTAPITIPGSGTGAATGAPASPYPSSIVVSGVVNPVSKVTVKLPGLGHGTPRDIDFLLAGPTGRKMIILSDAGGGFSASNETPYCQRRCSEYLRRGVA